MQVEVSKKEIEYIIGTCDKCCGFYPRVESTVDNLIRYKIYCPICNNSMETRELWKSVAGWNIMMRTNNK